MNPNLYAYSSIDPKGSFEHLGILFDSPIINNIIAIPSKKGSGQIKKIDAAKGLSIYSWDVQLLETFQLERPSDQLRDGNSFSLFYIFSPDHVVMTNKGNTSNTSGIPLKNIVFASGSISFDFLIKPWQPVRLIQIDITKEWLTEEYEHSGESTSPAYNNFLNNNEAVLFTEMASFDTCHTFANLLNHINQEHTDPFYLKAKTLSLLCDIFVLAGKRHEALPENTSIIHEKMLAVERILDQSLETTLPSIANIARQMAMSESTLKRNFKLLYGTSIYESYLQKKMKRAREIFSEQPVPVKEVAYRLGYEKVSNFIQMFKKYYHYSPGRLKKGLGVIEKQTA